MSNPIKFTVIIPTRERADTLRHSLRTVVEQDYATLTILVSDNFSQDNTREIVESFADARIKYINTGSRVSMSHNWEFALSHVSDGWVAFLGDDDGMMPGALERVSQVIKETGMSAVTSKWNLYFWPQSTNDENQLSIYFTSGYEIRDSQEWLKKLMQNLAYYSDLPYLYTGGFVDIELINRAKNKNGDFFCSMSPDVYSAVSLVSVVEKYVMLNEPVCVMGLSTHSTGTSSLGRDANPESLLKFISENNIPFHSKLASEKVKSIQLIVYESYLQSMHLHQDKLKIDMASQLGLALAACSNDAYRPELKKYCAEVADKNGVEMAMVERYADKNADKMKWYLRFTYLLNCWTQLRIDSSKYAVKDIYGATILAHTLHQFHYHDKYWRLGNIQKWLGSFIPRLCRILARNNK